MSEKPQSSHTFNTLALLGVIGGKAEKLGARSVRLMAKRVEIASCLASVPCLHSVSTTRHPENLSVGGTEVTGRWSAMTLCSRAEELSRSGLMAR